jgi:hypothetical protein
MESNKIIKILINGTEYELQTTIDNIDGLQAVLDSKTDASDLNNYYTKSYTDNALAQKSQVQIIKWEADD